MSRIIATIIITIFFSGCSLKTVLEPIVKYTIDSKISTPKVSQVDKILKISTLKAPLYMQSNGIWYQRPSFKTNSYLYSSWNENFSNLIEQSVANSLFKSGLFKSTFRSYSEIRPDFLLEGNIINAMQNVDKNKASVSFEIRLYLINQETFKLIGTKDFSYTKKCKTVDAKGAVVAYNEIIKILDKDVILWLKTLMKKN